MAQQKPQQPDYIGGLRRVLLGLIAVVLIGLFLLWRIDNARVETLRTEIVDRFAPSMEWTTKPVAATMRMVGDLSAWKRVYEQNAELRRELQRMEGWREAALQLEQKNARLLALNNVRLNPGMRFVTAEVIADSGSGFRRSALVNVGSLDGVSDGATVLDGLGLVGRIAGTGNRSARVVLLSDGTSRVPVLVRPSGQSAMLAGDNSGAPVLDFVDKPDEIRPGDRVVTSGAGGLYPPDLLVGQAVRAPDGRLRVRLATDYRALDFVRVVRHVPPPVIEGPGDLIGPLLVARPDDPGAAIPTAEVTQ